MDRENKPPIVINLRESMSYLTEVADPVKMLEDPFIKHNWHYIVALSKAKEAVELLHRSDDGKWDKSSWNGKDYEPFAVNVIKCICIHSSHQQRCENYVQQYYIPDNTSQSRVEEEDVLYQPVTLPNTVVTPSKWPDLSLSRARGRQ